MMSMEQDHYGVLELEPGSPMESVKSQYRRLAKLCHPDLHGADARCADQFRRVNAAYTFLSDAPRKAAYDAVLRAARKAGAPPLRGTPPHKPAPSPRATIYQTSVTAPEFQGGNVRMTRSAWLGATAGAIVVLLVIGLSLDGAGPDRYTPVGVASPFPPGSASGSMAGDESASAIGPEPGGPGPGTNADSLADSPALAPVTPRSDPAPPPRFPAVIASRAIPMRPVIEGGTQTDPLVALRRRLLAQSHAALPRTDRLLGRGYAVRAEAPGAGDGPRRALRAKLTSEMAGLSAVRAHLRPALARLSGPVRPEEMRRQAGPILTDLGRQENAEKPARDDIKALAAVPAAPSAAPAAFHFTPATPRTAPAPTMTSAAPQSPKSSETSTSNSPSRPTAQATSGQEFIRWRNKQ